MEIQSERRLPLPRDTVWEALNDTGVLQRCIPGCQSMEAVGENRYQALVIARVGPVRANFRGHVSLLDVSPPESYTLRFEGQGGAAGFARGEADVRLGEDEGRRCRLAYTARAMVGGKLAQIGSRLVRGTADRMAKEFFDNLATELGCTIDDGRAATADPAPGERSPEPEGEHATERRDRLQRRSSP